LKVFFDNCTSPVFAGCLDALIRPDGHEAHHVRFMPQYGFNHNTKDIDWITRLSAESADWIVITGDQRIRRNMAERAAWKRAGLRAFVLAPAYQKTPINQCASVILWRWPAMEQFIKLAVPGSMFELSINRKTGFAPLAV
jgi:PIN domain-containing protein